MNEAWNHSGRVNLSWENYIQSDQLGNANKKKEKEIDYYKKMIATKMLILAVLVASTVLMCEQARGCFMK